MKKRILSFLLALLLLFGMLPVNVIAEGTEDYSGNVTGTAVFNPEWNTVSDDQTVYGVAYVTNDPTLGLNMSTDYTMSLEGVMGQTFYINDYYSDGTGYWYELAALEGETLPEKLAAMPWVYQNDIPNVGYPDYLIVTPPVVEPTDPTEPDPTDPSIPDDSCECCENCTGAEDCECGCGNCQFCEPEEPTIPEVSDGNVIASGNLGEGAKLTVSAGSADKAEAFTSILSDLEDVNIFNQYVYDIDLSGSFEGSVELSVSGIPSAGSNERLLVIHLLDSAAAIEKARAAGTLQTYTGENLHLIYPEETAASGDNNTIYYEEISARRVAGNVTFSTSSFSEFIIYTVDFHYNGFEFSIPGGSGIYLSELFDRIGIERSVADVSSVTFTNYDLLSVVEDGDDWLLTSLRPFTSEEVLTILFSDGMEIAIAVTDASYDSSLFIFAFCANDTDIPSVDKGYTYIENDKTNLLGRYKWIIHNNIIGGDGVITLENINKKTVTAYAQKPGRVEIRGTRNNDDSNYTTFQVFVFRSEDHFAFCGSKEAQAVSVRVVDKNGKIVTGVPVTISRSGASYTAKTDEFGYAWFFNLPGETTYTVNVAEFKASDGHWYTASSSVTTPKAKDNIFESGSFHISQSTPSYSYVSEYSIVYHANDGSGETMTDSEHVKSGGQVTVDANSFSRDGYTFGGWYGSSDGTGKNYAVGSKATLTADLNVYVKWNPISYVVSFDVVGATSGAIANKTYTFDTRYTLPTPEKKYTVTYNHNDAADHGGTAVTSTADAAVTFDGWMDQGAITFKGKSYSYQGLETERTKFDAPFYANPNKSSDVYEHVGNHYNKYGLVKHFFEYGINEYYNQNSEIRKPAPTSDLEKPGVYPGGAVVSNLSTTANAIVSLVARWSAAETLTLPTLTRTDYNFAGWYSDAALTNYVGDAGDPYTPTGDAELYAKWNPKTYGVTYMYTGTVPNGAPNVPVDANSYTSGSSVMVKSAPTPAPTGYTFSGWSADGITITNGKFTMPATDVTFTGSWTPKTDATYTVHYYKEGTTEKVQNDKVVNGATFDKVYSETAPETIDNYIIVGDKTKTVTAGYTGNEVTFYYKLNAFSVSYDYTGDIPDGAPVAPSATTETVGSDVTVADAPTLTGYTFSGWSADGITITNGKFTMPNKAVTFTGSWSVNQYDITYQYADDKTADKKVAYTIEDQVTLEEAPTREGYEFKGWKLDNAADTNWTAGIFTASANIGTGKYGNITLVAQWEAQYRYVLKFDANGGSNAPAQITQDWKAESTHTFNWSGTPTRDGYTFLGWAESADSVEKVADNSYILTGKKAETAEKTLYAIWQRDTGSILLDYTGDGTPVIVAVTCTQAVNESEKITITMVIDKDTTVANLPTGTYQVTAKSGNASYTASVKSGSPATVEKGKTAEVEITTGTRGMNWFTAFFRVKNKCS